MMKTKVPKQLDAIADAVLAYRPKARSKPAIQRKRRKTILENITEHRRAVVEGVGVKAGGDVQTARPSDSGL